MVVMRKSSLFITGLLCFGTVFLLLVGLHTYQYFRIRSNLAPLLIQEAGRENLQEIERFFKQITSTLTMVRDWGVNDTLDLQDTVGLNKKFFPLLDNQETIRSLILADEQGMEYYLYRQDDHWITRSRQGDDSVLRWQQWKAPDHAVKRWEEASEYNPRQRPWFRQAIGRQGVSWTSVYTFYQSGEKGITASISWQNRRAVVCGLDLPIRQIRDLLEARQERQAYTLFLVNRDDSTVITASDDEKTAILAEEAITSWKAGAAPAGQVVTFQRDRERWQAIFKPVNRENLSFWLGVAAPANRISTPFASALLSFTTREVLMAMAGGLLLFLLVWQLRRSGGPEETTPLQLLEQTIAGGESSRAEFKSTVRTNLKTGKQGKEIELAWLKAVVAFLNSQGGILLLGVADDGSILGLDADGFDSNDRCLLHIKNLLNQHLGAEFFRFIRITLVETPDGRVVMIQCTPAGKPVFLRIGKNEEFYIRSGPASTKLSPSQIVNYIQKKQ